MRAVGTPPPEGGGFGTTKVADSRVGEGYCYRVKLRNQSSPNCTSRSKALVLAARDIIRTGETVVDLGAGREAVLCRSLLKECPDCKLIAVEPFVPISAPESIEPVRGDITALPERSVDVILFNSPNTPDHLLDSEDGSYFQFAGGPNGYECIQEILLSAPSRLRDGGRLVFICPTFTVLPDMPWRLEVLAHYFEPIEEPSARAPVKKSLRAGYVDFLVGRQDAQQGFWAKLVPIKPGHITAVVLCLRL